MWGLRGVQRGGLQDLPGVQGHALARWCREGQGCAVVGVEVLPHYQQQQPVQCVGWMAGHGRARPQEDWYTTWYEEWLV